MTENRISEYFVQTMDEMESLSDELQDIWDSFVYNTKPLMN